MRLRWSTTRWTKVVEGWSTTEAGGLKPTSCAVNAYGNSSAAIERRGTKIPLVFTATSVLYLRGPKVENAPKARVKPS